jgi:hypothetical protein
MFTVHPCPCCFTRFPLQTCQGMAHPYFWAVTAEAQKEQEFYPRSHSQEHLAG